MTGNAKPEHRGYLPPLALILSVLPCQQAPAGDALTQIDSREISVGGLIGKRIDMTVKNNLLVLDVDKTFLAPFKEKNRDGGYIGLGKLIEAVARFERPGRMRTCRTAR
jgi:hypothetical protein